jgi:CRISPR-associated protein Cas2
MDKQRILLLCDLPLEKRNQRKEARLFKEMLFSEGFFELQPGVYTRMVESRSSRDIHLRRIKEKLPPYGRVRLITLTENQFQNAPLLCGEETMQGIIGSELDIFI